MTELTFLAVSRLMNACYEPLTARRLLPAGPATVRALLVHPDTYHGVAQVRPSNSERVIVVGVHVSPRTVLRYTWMLTPNRGTTEVELAVQLESRGPHYRLALLLGGTQRLHRQLEATLARISHVTVCSAEGMGAAQTTHAVPAPRHDVIR